MCQCKERFHCESLDAAVQQTCHIHNVVTQIGDGWHMTYKQQNVAQVALLISLSSSCAYKRAKPSFVDLLAVQQLDWPCLVHIIIEE